MRALVTGGAGFIGSHLVDALLAGGHAVTVVDDLSTGRVANLDRALAAGAALHPADVTDAPAIARLAARARPDVVFHLAGHIDVRRALTDPVRDARANVLGTASVLEAARPHGARVVLASTGGALYGDAETLPTPENARIAPSSPYGVSKAAAESYLALYARTHGMATVSLRLANVYGPRQDPRGEGGVIARFCAARVHAAAAVVYGDGRQTRDFVFVGDAVEAFLAAAHADARGAVNVGTGIEASVLDLVAGLGLDPSFAPSRPGEVARSCLDPAAARLRLSWSARTPLADGLIRTLDATALDGRSHATPTARTVAHSPGPTLKTRRHDMHDMTTHDDGRRLGVAVVGLGGAVATTAVAGVELLRLGLAGADGLPLAGAEDLIGYEQLVFGGWDLSGDDLAAAAERHDVLEPGQLAAAGPALAAVQPWPAIVDGAFCRNIDGAHRLPPTGHRDRIAAVRADLRRFTEEHALDAVVVVNLASVERSMDPSAPAVQSVPALEAALDRDDPTIGPALLYAYAALREGVPYANFTPSVAVDVPAMVALADELGVPVAGKDGKTGQTFIKTVIAPALRSRALRVDGWFSTNILGNQDGLALDDPDSLAAKLETKRSVLDSILGYPVENHIVRIEYYPPRGDDKEAWDTVDLVGFLGRPMQLKLNFLCRDSILAAPLVIEIARVLDLAQRTGHGGVQEQLGAFFKAPMASDDQPVEHAHPRQALALESWLESARAVLTAA